MEAAVVTPRVRETIDARVPAPSMGAEDRDSIVGYTWISASHNNQHDTEALAASSERGSPPDFSRPMSALSTASAFSRKPGATDDGLVPSTVAPHVQEDVSWRQTCCSSGGARVTAVPSSKQGSGSDEPLCHLNGGETEPDPRASLRQTCNADADIAGAKDAGRTEIFCVPCKSAPRRHQPYIECIDVQESDPDEPLVLAYRRRCEEIGISPNPILIETFEAIDRGTNGSGQLDALEQHIHVHCPGNVKPVFCHRLDDRGMVPAVKTMASCGPRLRSLSLPYNKLTYTSAVSLSALLLKCPAMRSLNLRANDIDGIGARKLCEGLSVCSWIENLDLSLNPIGNDGALALAEWLRSNRSLKQLNVDSCRIALDGLIAIATTLREVNRTIDILSIADVEKVPVQAEHFFHLGSMVEINNTLAELCLSKQRLRDHGVKVMVPFLKQNRSLKRVDLSCNQITFLGAKAICDLLRVNTPLQVLNLDCNRLTKHGARYLALGVQANHKLKILHLNNNSISPEGLIDLAEALMTNDCLLEVSLAMNQFDSKSAAVFGRLIGPNSPRRLPLKTDFMTYEVDDTTFISSIPLASTCLL